MFGYREYDHNVCVDENFIKNSIKMKFNEKITSNLFGSVRLLTEMVLIVIYSWFRF